MNKFIKSLLSVLLLLSVPLSFLISLSVLIVDLTATGANLLFMIIHTALVLMVLRFTPFWPKNCHFLWAPACLAWGAFGSIGLVTFIAPPIVDLVAKLSLDDFLASFAGGYPEEIAKAIGILLILYSFRGLNRPWHGLATGMLVGTGFDVYENFSYASEGALLNPSSDLLGVTLMWIGRTIFGPGLHLMFAGFTGFGIGLALFALGRSTLWRVSVASFWFLFAFAVHFLWNYVVTTPVYVLVITGILIYSALIAVVIWNFIQAAKDSGYLTVELSKATESKALLPAR